MNSRERVVAALAFESPDRVPIMHRTLPGAFRVYGKALTDLYDCYPSDVMLDPASGQTFRFSDLAWWQDETGVSVDTWRCAWRRESDDYQGQILQSPLCDLSELKSYKWPDPMGGYETIAEMIRVMKEDKHQHYYLAICGTLMHRMTYLRGFENTLMDLALGNEEILFIRDRIVDILLRRIDILTKAGADGVLMVDDWGGQDTMFVNPGMWRKLFKPAYKKLAEAIHAGGAYAHFHIDGVVTDIIPDLIEIGFDELNPQVWVMDVPELSRRFRGKVCFRADLDRQFVLRAGTPEDVSRHIRRTYQAFGLPSGGYIGYGQVGPDVPLTNVEAMLITFATL